MVARKITVVLTLAAGCFCLPAQGQTLNDTLKEATVRDQQAGKGNYKVTRYAPGQKLTRIDTLTLQQYRMQSVATMLAQQLPVFIKSYGFNGLATLNFRGSSAAQSAVLWNGAPIQNAALGMADVSVLPVMLMDNVAVLYGGSAAMQGSGNVGGALLLDANRSDIFIRHFTVGGGLGAGSYAQYSGNVVVSAGGKRLYGSVAALWQQSRNNFTFTNANGERAELTNSRMTARTLMADAGYNTTGGLLELHTWLQKYDRQIPPALYELTSAKSQHDHAGRVQLQWTPHKRARLPLTAIAQLSKDRIVYADSAIPLHSSIAVLQYYHEVRWHHDLYRWGSVDVFSPMQLAWTNDIADSRKQQQRIALAAAYANNLLDGKLRIAGSIRIESVDSNNIAARKPFVLGGGNAAYSVLPWLTLRGNVQQTYRVPTLNELYYYPGGNTALKPEQGVSMDAGYNLYWSKGPWRISHDAALFGRHINDWIIWLGGAVWTPHNIARVYSRGTETETKVTWRSGNWQLHAGLNTAYVLATTERSYLYNDGSIGKQIPYSPRYNGQANAGIAYKRFYLNYNHAYTGYRFTVSDESAWLIPYQTGNVQVMCMLPVKQATLQLNLQLNNIWNEQYSVVAARPMPGRNVLLGVSVKGGGSY